MRVTKQGRVKGACQRFGKQMHSTMQQDKRDEPAKAVPTRQQRMEDRGSAEGTTSRDAVDGPSGGRDVEPSESDPRQKGDDHSEGTGR